MKRLLAICLCFSLCVVAIAQTPGTFDITFNSVSASISEVHDFVIQSDGKIVVIGDLGADFETTKTRGIARLHPDGAFDESFAFESSETIEKIYCTSNDQILILIGGKVTCLLNNGQVDANFVPFKDGNTAQLLTQPDGKIMLVENNNDGTQTLYRMNSDGSKDATFNSLVFLDISNLVLLPDGNYLIPSYNLSAQYRIKKVSPTGQYISGYTTPIKSIIADISLAEDEKILVAEINTNDWSTRLWRLNQNGSNDSTFSSELDGIYRILATPDKKAIVFDWNLYQLNEDGSIDSSYINNRIGDLQVMKFLSDGKLLWTGGGGFKRRLVTGETDTTFKPVTPSPYNTVLPTSNGFLACKSSFPESWVYELNHQGAINPGFTPLHFAIGGNLLSVRPDGSFFVAVIDTLNFMWVTKRFLSNGAVDDSFSMPEGLKYWNMASCPDGSFICPGFDSSNYLVRLNSNGSLDSSFISESASYVSYGPIIGSAGDIYTSEYINNEPRWVKRFPNGEIDQAFTDLTENLFIGGILGFQPDGKIIVSRGEQEQLQIFRLNTDGSEDFSFPIYSTSDYLFSSVIDNFGYIVLAFREKLICLMPNGEINSNYVQGNYTWGSQIHQLYVTSDNKILARGDIAEYNGICTDGLFRLHGNTATDISELNLSSQDNGILIFPNPFSDSFSIRENGSNPISEITIYDVTGAIQLAVKIDRNNGTTIVDSKGWKVGTYLLKAKSKRGIICEKLIKR